MNDFIQPFGYAELYELTDIDQHKYGRFVKFDKNNPSKIVFADNKKNLVGVTSTNFSFLSNSYKEWPWKYLHDEYGETLLKNEILAEGKLEYDDLNEITYIHTYKKEEYVPAINSYYDANMEYIERTKRYEWIPVILLGQCIVEDDGSCIPGKNCDLYDGDNKELFGTVKLAEEGWYVLKRISKNTIMILLK